MTSPYDPLGRIAAQEKLPYDHPHVSITGLERYWRDQFSPWAHGLMDGDLQLEHAQADADVETCEAAIEEAKRDAESIGAQTWGRADVERCMTHEESVALTNANAAITTAQARMPRLKGKRDALAAEMARRVGT